jgi:hypothetical protein
MSRTVSQIALALIIFTTSQSIQVQSQAIPDGPAKDAAATLADLNAVTIEGSIVHQQVIHRDGHQYPNQTRFDLKVSIRDGRIEGSSRSSGRDFRGPYKGKVQPISSTIEKPVVSGNYGGGNGVWFMNERTLTSLFVFKDGGAFKREIFFSRADNVLACTIKDTFARENGTGAHRVELLRGRCSCDPV